MKVNKLKNIIKEHINFLKEQEESPVNSCLNPAAGNSVDTMPPGGLSDGWASNQAWMGVINGVGMYADCIGEPHQGIVQTGFSEFWGLNTSTADDDYGIQCCCDNHFQFGLPHPDSPCCWSWPTLSNNSTSVVIREQSGEFLCSCDQYCYDEGYANGEWDEDILDCVCNEGCPEGTYWNSHWEECLVHVDCIEQNSYSYNPNSTGYTEEYGYFACQYDYGCYNYDDWVSTLYTATMNNVEELGSPAPVSSNGDGVYNLNTFKWWVCHELCEGNAELWPNHETPMAWSGYPHQSVGDYWIDGQTVTQGTSICDCECGPFENPWAETSSTQVKLDCYSCGKDGNTIMQNTFIVDGGIEGPEERCPEGWTGNPMDLPCNKVDCVDNIDILRDAGYTVSLSVDCEWLAAYYGCYPGDDILMQNYAAVGYLPGTQYLGGPSIADACPESCGDCVDPMDTISPHKGKEVDRMQTLAGLKKI